MTEGLKPCPFCGGKVRLESSHGFNYVLCKKCKSEYYPASFGDLKKTVAAWNSRQVEDAQAAEIKRLREALEIYKEALHEGLWKTGLQDSIWEIIEQAEEKAEQILKGGEE